MAKNLWALALTLWLASSLPVSAQPADNPYKGIETLHLKNGLTAVLAPSNTANLVKIRAEVKAGFQDEKWGKAGTAHLLEHYAFWSPALDPGLTYLDVIKEKGGSGNAVTQTRKTVFYAKIESKKGTWLLETFSKILFHKQFREDAVELAKKPVYLEIGKPNLFDYLSPSRLYFYQQITGAPSFWKQEFDIDTTRDLPPQSSDKIDTRALNAKDLEGFYRDYYRPDNIVLYIAGGFDVRKAKMEIQNLFGAELSRSGPVREEPKPVAKTRPYRYVSENSLATPRIETGTKLAGISAQDKIVADIYLNDLAHRLMKTLRNMKGETYTVSPHLRLKKGFGIASVSFEAPAESYRKNLEYVRDLIKNETQARGVSETQFQEAKRLYE